MRYMTINDINDEFLLINISILDLLKLKNWRTIVVFQNFHFEENYAEKNGIYTLKSMF